MEPEFKDWLNDTEIELSHRNVKKVYLEDIYVAPHLKNLNEDIDSLVKPCDASIALEKKHSIVFGGEQSGKTSLAKEYCRSLVNQGLYPIYIDSADIKSSKFEVALKKLVGKQYKGVTLDEIVKSNSLVVIIDDLSDLKLNDKHKDILIESVKDIAFKVVLFSDDSYQYIIGELGSTEDFSLYEILPLGHVKRSELAQKWVSLGVEEQIDEKYLYSQVDELKLKLNSIVRGNVLPAKPIFILSMLQMFEAYTPQNLDLTSYGHCYQYLVYQSLEKSRIKSSEIDMYLNVLTELAWSAFKNEGRMQEKEVARFFSEYSSRFVLESNSNMETVITKLIESGLLISRDELISFRYPYVHYFFVAKKVAEGFNDHEYIKNEIRLLLDNLHREDCANIIIFITHHTKESWILDEIQISLMEMFDEYNEAELSKESLEFMEEFISSIPELVIEQRQIESVRRRKDENQDKIEQIAESDKQDLEPADILAKINKAFKGMEVIGQIIRNRHASIHKELLFEMVAYATSTGLRFLQYFLEISDVTKDEVIKTVAHMLEVNPEIEAKDVEREAKNTFLMLSYGVILGVIKKISASVGSKEAEEIYNLLEKEKPTPAIKLIHQAIDLQFTKKLDIKQLKSLKDEFNSNPTCCRILREIVVQHIYMFPVGFKEKQRISEALSLSIEGQRLMDMQRELKV